MTWFLRDGNYGMDVYGMESVHNREPERSRVTISVAAESQKGSRNGCNPYPS